MEVTQVANLMNAVTKEVIGESAIVREDLSNVIDIGTQILNFGEKMLDNYTRALLNQIGRMIFVNRVYDGYAPNVLMDGWEYGSICEKIRSQMPDAEENDTWNLQDGVSYDQDVFHKPEVSAKFFNQRVTLEIPMSFAVRQVKESFQNGRQLNAFFSMIENSINKSLTVKMDALIMRTINNMAFSTLLNGYSDGSANDYIVAGSSNAVNLLKLYNDNNSIKITFNECMHNPEFLRLSSYVINSYINKIRALSVLFNISRKEDFTPRNLLHVVMLSDFVSAFNMYLQSDTFHQELTSLPRFETVPFWQASGNSLANPMDIKNLGGLHINGKYLNAEETIITGAMDLSYTNATIDFALLCVMFDHDALGVSNIDQRVTTHYNAKGEFWNNYYKFDAGYFNDWDENFVAFYIADYKTQSGKVNTSNK